MSGPAGAPSRLSWVDPHLAGPLTIGSTPERKPALRCVCVCVCANAFHHPSATRHPAALRRACASSTFLLLCSPLRSYRNEQRCLRRRRRRATCLSASVRKSIPALTPVLHGILSGTALPCCSARRERINETHPRRGRKFLHARAPMRNVFPLRRRPRFLASQGTCCTYRAAIAIAQRKEEINCS